MLTAGTTTYTWTPRSTMATQKIGTAAATTFTFDGLGRQTKSNAQTYTYDSLDRVAARGTTGFSYVGAEIDPVAVGTTVFARGAGAEPIAAKIGTSAASLIGLDPHGDAGFQFVGSATVSATRVYDPMGKPLATTGTFTTIGFQGDYTDPTTADVWMGARWYRPGTGNFVSRDTVFGTLDTPISLNRYTYAQADPLGMWDPDGRWPKILEKAAAAATGLVQDVGSTTSRVVQRGTRTVVRGAQNVGRATTRAAQGVGDAAYGGFGWVSKPVEATLFFGGVGNEPRVLPVFDGSAESAEAWADDYAQQNATLTQLSSELQVPLRAVAELLPYNSLALNGSGAVTGRDAITQEKLTTQQRVVMGVGAALELAGPALGAFSEVRPAFRAADNVLPPSAFPDSTAHANPRPSTPSTSTAAKDLADSMPRPPGMGDPRTVAVLDTPSGGRYQGTSGSGVAPHPRVQQALDNVPGSSQSPFHSHCAEIQCLSGALNAGDNVAGGAGSAVRVRGPNSPAHGTPISPCTSCQAVLDEFGVQW
jgi:RHS repeat-associated protein